MRKVDGVTNDGKAPCKNCTDRCFNCHSTCADYLKYREAMEEVYKARVFDVIARKTNNSNYVRSREDLIHRSKYGY